MTITSGSADAGLLLHFCLMNLEVACFDFAGGKWTLLVLEVACFVFAGGKQTFPNGMPFVRSYFSCLAPRDLVMGGGKRTFPNGMPTFSIFDVLQGSCGFVSNVLLARGHEMCPLRIQSVL